MSNIFISYARSTTASQAQAIAKAFRGLGFGVWMDDEIPAHRDFTEVLEERLQAAKAVVVVWSAEAVKSQWVQSEADRAREEGKLVQLNLDGVRLPMPFDRVQCADMTGWNGDLDAPGWRRVVASVTELVGDPSSAGGAPAPSAAPPQITNNLPRRQSALIGREAELTALATLLKKADLVTITGTGGVGKTCIAIEVGALQVNDHEDGVWLAELAPVSDPEQVPGAVARAMNIDLPAGEEPMNALVDRLRVRRCLILLDNCEHVIDAVAALAEAVLDTSDGVKMLASSQELLGVEGEQVFRLRSLGEPDAVALFTERAQAVDADFKITKEAAVAAAAICQRLDGIPLAIEMAAARAPSLGCEGVLERLDDRFRVLTGGRRTALPRQRTLLATLDWSHGLLSPADAAVFRRLGIFTGGFSLEAASEVGADDQTESYEVTDAVSSLVAKSLVVADSGEHGPRYRLLETTRAYGLEKLDAAGETIGAQRRHAEYFLKFMTLIAGDYRGRVSDEAIEARYYADLDNVDRAIDWALGPNGDAELGIALVAASCWLWGARSLLPEYIRWIEVAASRLSATTPTLVRTAFLVARATALMLTNAGKAMDVVDEAIQAARALGDPVVLAEALNAKGYSLTVTGRVTEARLIADELIALMAGLPPSRVAGTSRHLGATVTWAQQGDGVAQPLFDTVVAELRSFGADGMANFYTVNGTTSLVPKNDPERAIGPLRDLLERIRPGEMFSGLSTGQTAMFLMMLLAGRNAPGDLDEAMSVARTYQKAAGRGVVYAYFGVLSQIAVKAGRPRDAARLASFADSLRAAVGSQFFLGVESASETWALIRAVLPEDEVEALRAEGAKMSLDDAYRLAMGE